jgi:transcriptional regulator with XRE-family HTH domain
MEEGMAKRIKTLRQEKGLTLEQVADVVGVGKSTVRKWETGMIVNMRRDKIADLAKALGTTPAYLMGWKEDEKETPNQPELTGIETEMIKLFRQFPGVEQELLVIMMQNLYSVPAGTRGPALETLQAFWKTIQKP